MAQVWKIIIHKKGLEEMPQSEKKRGLEGMPYTPKKSLGISLELIPSTQKDQGVNNHTR